MDDLSDEQKRQLNNCYEVIRVYQEKQKKKPKEIRFIKEPVIEEKKKKKNNNDSETISRMLGRIKHLTPEERMKATEMLDYLEQYKGHNRSRGRGR